jgi:hypothetical protein
LNGRRNAMLRNHEQLRRILTHLKQHFDEELDVKLATV